MGINCIIKLLIEQTRTYVQIEFDGRKVNSCKVILAQSDHNMNERFSLPQMEERIIYIFLCLEKVNNMPKALSRMENQIVVCFPVIMFTQHRNIACLFKKLFKRMLKWTLRGILIIKYFYRYNIERTMHGMGTFSTISRNGLKIS